MADNFDVKATIVAQDKASGPIKGIGGAADGLHGKLSGLGKIAGGTFAGITGAAVAGKVASFAKDSMAAYGDLAGQVKLLQRYTGGTAEDMSHMAAVARMSGMDTEKLAAGMGKLSKNLAGGGKEVTALGIDFKDATGKILPMDKLMPQLADKLNAMPNGAEKTALMMKLFGKAGMDLLPFLAKGSEGMAEIAAESDKLGTTLSGKDMDATKENTLAKRKMHEATLGLQVAIGQNLYPTFTSFVSLLTEKVVPVIKKVLDWMKEHKEVVSKVAMVVATLVVGLGAFTKVVGALNAVLNAAKMVWAALNAIMAMNPIVLVVLAVVALIAILVLAYRKSETFRAIVDAVWEGIKTAFQAGVDFVKGVLNAGWEVIKALFRWSPVGLIVTHWDGIKTAVGNVIGVVRNVVSGVFDFFRTVFNWSPIGLIVNNWGKVTGFFAGVRDQIVGIFNGVKDSIAGAFRGAVNAAISAWNRLDFAVGPWAIPSWVPVVGGKTFHIKDIFPDIPFLGAGGIALGPTLAVIGERGPEAVVPLPSGGGLLGGTAHVTLNLDSRVVWEGLVDLRRRKGDVALGLG